MQNILLRRLQGILVCVVGLVTMILVTACAGVGGSSANGTTTTGVGTTPQSQGTQPSVAFQPGTVSFIGPVKSVDSGTVVMSMPDGQTFTMIINSQTKRSDFGGNLPTVGALVSADAQANPDGSFTATKLKSATPGDKDQNVVDFRGMTTSLVGADRVIHLTVGTRVYTFPISPTADLGDFNGNTQSIGNNMPVKVKVQFNGSTSTAIKISKVSS
jgi:Domain of unknown function (DUF5666)